MLIPILNLTMKHQIMKTTGVHVKGYSEHQGVPSLSCSPILELTFGVAHYLLLLQVSGC